MTIFYHIYIKNDYHYNKNTHNVSETFSCLVNRDIHIGFGEEITQVESIEVNFTLHFWSSDKTRCMREV